MSNKKERVDVIVLSSGAIRGFYQLGALYYLYEKIIYSPRYFAGTSVGAAIAGGLAVGYKPVEIFSYLCENDVSEVLKIDLNIKLYLERWGAIDEKKVKEYMNRMIKNKWGHVPTFKELEENDKNLIITSYKLTSNNPNVYFTAETHPNMLISDAIVLSMTLPLIFGKGEYENNLYVDGGVFDRLPGKFALEYALKKEKERLSEIYLYGIDLRQPINNKCDTIQSYIKQLFYIPMKLQPEFPEEYERSNLIHINTTEGDLSLYMTIKERTEAFCKGASEVKKWYLKKKLIQDGKKKQD
jgi:hypothetical protein